jgi:hypothetical protein
MTLGMGSLGDGLGQRLLQACGQRRAGQLAVEEQRLGLAVGRRLQLRHGTLASAPSAASFFSSAGVGAPAASSATATGISFCARAVGGRAARR